MLERFGLSPGFIAMIKVMYVNIESVLKINGGLSRPFNVTRGIRQGCSMSGMLYTLAIEPMLHNIRTFNEGLVLPGFNTRFILSAYADDIYNKRKLSERRDTVWKLRLNVPGGCEPVWRVFYKPPLNKRSGDLQWRILHGALGVNAFVSKINPTVSSECPFCTDKETITHCYLDCHRLKPLFNVLKTVFLDCG